LVQKDVLTYLKERIKEVLTGAGATVVVRTFGPDMDVLRTKATEIAAAVKTVPGVTDLKVEAQVLVPQLDVRLRPEAAARLGLTRNVAGRDLGSVAREIEAKVKAMDFPREYHPEFLGEYAAREESRRRLMALAALSLIGVLVVIQSDFRTVRLTALVFMTL